MIYKSFDKKSAGGGMKSEVNEKVKKRNVYSPFMGGISGIVLSDMQLISKYNNLLLWFLVYMHGLVPWRIKTGGAVNKVFPKIVNNSGRKPNKTSVEKGNQF